MKRIGFQHVMTTLFAAAAALTAGCVGYRLGSTLPPDVKTIRVNTFVNKSGEPLLETYGTGATINEFQRDGTLSVVQSKNADLVLDTTITKFRLQPVRYSSKNNPLQGEEYRMQIFVTITLTRLKGGEKVMLTRNVYGETTFNVNGDMSTSKLDALPAAAKDLAHHIVQEVVEYW